MRPATITQAQQHMRQLLTAKITGKRSTRVKEHTRRANRIAKTLYRKFQLGPYQYRLGHIRWYLAEHIQSLTPNSQYRHWLTIREILMALEQWANWKNQLEGSWVRIGTGNQKPH